MKIDILTLFPDMFSPVTGQSILGRAVESGLLEIGVTNIRDHTKDKHKKTDDTPYGGGAGMILTPQPVFDALRSIGAKGKRILYMSPRGRLLDQTLIRELSQEPELVILCGHYEGVDQRILDGWDMEEVCIGDYMLTTEDGGYIKYNLDLFVESDGQPSDEDKARQVESVEELALTLRSEQNGLDQDADQSGSGGSGSASEEEDQGASSRLKNRQK